MKSLNLYYLYYYLVYSYYLYDLYYYIFIFPLLNVEFGKYYKEFMQRFIRRFKEQIEKFDSNIELYIDHKI